MPSVLNLLFICTIVVDGSVFLSAGGPDGHPVAPGCPHRPGLERATLAPVASLLRLSHRQPLGPSLLNHSKPIWQVNAPTVLIAQQQFALFSVLAHFLSLSASPMDLQVYDMTSEAARNLKTR